MNNKNYKDVNTTQKGTAEDMAMYHMEMAAQDMYEALLAIIDECPEPKLPYGKKIVEIAKQALLKADGKSC